MKDDAIRQSMASIENRVRHVYNQGFEAGRKAERKTGRWEFVSYGDGLGNYHCSECRAIASSYLVGNLVKRHWEYKLTKYCGGCGAKMEGAEE